MLWIIVVIVFCLLFVVWCVIFDSEDFPDYYNPVCFDCNKGGDACPTCRFRDPEYREPLDSIKWTKEGKHYGPDGKETDIW
jgi:hypothetical protein